MPEYTIHAHYADGRASNLLCAGPFSTKTEVVAALSAMRAGEYAGANISAYESAALPHDTLRRKLLRQMPWGSLTDRYGVER